MMTVAASATNYASTLGALHSAPCARIRERCSGSRPLGPAQHPG